MRAVNPKSGFGNIPRLLLNPCVGDVELSCGVSLYPRSVEARTGPPLVGPVSSDDEVFPKTEGLVDVMTVVAEKE